MQSTRVPLPPQEHVWVRLQYVFVCVYVFCRQVLKKIHGCHYFIMNMCGQAFSMCVYVFCRRWTVTKVPTSPSWTCMNVSSVCWPAGYVSSQCDCNIANKITIPTPNIHMQYTGLGFSKNDHNCGLHHLYFSFAVFCYKPCLCSWAGLPPSKCYV